MHGLSISSPYVNGFDSTTGMGEESAHSLFLHLLDLTGKLLRIQLVVPLPERDRSMLSTGDL
ncbi:hypothetical protein DVH26_23430 [Paenibacillus sp. H1-7]|nr:hypothetical protein DVH26_23430 [Paenibacillus sp. H1-7]